MQRYRSGHNGADSKSVWEQSHEGSNPSRCAMSPRTTYRSRRLFYKSHLSLILLRLLSKPDPLSLGSGLGPPLCGGFFWSPEDIDFDRPFHVGASYVSLAPTFFKSQSALTPLLLVSNCEPSGSGSGLERRSKGAGG